MRKTYHAYILIAPLMAGCVPFYIVPFALILRHSFLRGSGRSAPFVGLENYMEVIGSEAFARALSAIPCCSSPWACRLLCWFPT